VSVEPARQEDTMTVALVTFSKSGTRREFAIKKGATVIGRKTDADLRIPLDEISRSHCEISVEGDQVILRDLESRNGTFLNDEEISEAPVNAGDRIRLGPVVFFVQIDGEPKNVTASSPVPKRADDTPSDVATTIASSSLADDSGPDIGALDEDMDVEELSDLDLGEIDDLEDSDDLEEIDELEELSDDDISES